MIMIVLEIKIIFNNKIYDIFLSLLNTKYYCLLKSFIKIESVKSIKFNFIILILIIFFYF